MKTKIYLLILPALFLAQLAHAAILNVNNSNPSPGEYTVLQDAFDAAAAGDSIYLAATSLSYGDATIEKELHVFGPGFVVTSGVLGNRAIVGILYYNADADNSSVTGIQMTQFYAEAASQTVGGIKLQRCIVTEYLYMFSNVTTNWLLEGNVFISNSVNIWNSGTNTGWTVQNNIFNGSLNQLGTSNIKNNIFPGTSGGNGACLSASVINSSITNNIFIGRNVAGIAASNVINGNISYLGLSNTFPGAGTNFNVDPEFVNYTSGFFNWTYDFTLSGTSPAIASGAGGEDIGLYGGTGIYRKDGEPSIPIIRSVNVPGGNVVPANSSFNINILSESHE